VKQKIQQGDILQVTLDPALGSEIQGRRPVLVLSNVEFNSSGRALVAAITQGGNLDRIKGWAVTLMGTGTKTQGAAVISQCRMIDLQARAAKRVETVPAAVIEEALAKLQAALD
jgi:mRNA interferase ChpB